MSGSTSFSSGAAHGSGVINSVDGNLGPMRPSCCSDSQLDMSHLHTKEKGILPCLWMPHNASCQSQLHECEKTRGGCEDLVSPVTSPKGIVQHTLYNGFISPVAKVLASTAD